MLLLKWWAATLVQWALYPSLVHRVKFRYSARLTAQFVRASVPPVLSILVINLATSAGLFFVRYEFGDSATAIYGVALQISLAYATAGYLAIRVITPHILGEFGLVRSFVNRMIAFMTALLVSLGLAAYVLAVLLIRTCMRPEFAQSLGPLPWLLLAGAMMCSWCIVYSYLLRFDRQWIALVITVCTTSAAWLAYLPLAQRLGLNGVALTNVGSFGAATLAGLWLTKRLAADRGQQR